MNIIIGALRLIALTATCFLLSCKADDDTPLGAHSQLIALDKADKDLILTYHDLHILVDSTGTMNFESIQNKSENFQRLADFKNSDYNANYAYWVKLEIDQQPQDENIWVLEFYDQTIDSIDAYLPDVASTTYMLKQFGDRYTYNKRTFQHKNFQLLLPDYAQRVTYYFRVKSTGFADIRIALRSLNRFIYYALNEYMLYGIFYGMIAIIALYNFLIYFAIREKKYLFYIFYLLSVAFYAMSVDGIAFQYFWPNAPGWNQMATGVFSFMLIIGALVFSKAFLNIRHYSIFLSNIYFGIIIARALMFIAGLFLPSMLYLRWLDIIPLGFIFGSGIFVFMKGYRPARFFILAYGILFLGFFIKALVQLNVIPFTIITYYILHICFLLEMLFLTFALGDRVRILKNNRDRANKRIISQLEENARLKDKVNRELELKVKQRTTQLDAKNQLLEESNVKLREQSDVINNINSMLDLDNWKLRNNIKKVLQDRVFHRQITTEEFKAIFPDEKACYRYLYNLKWSDSFTCRKCGNHKSFEGANFFSRRCTKCGYDESVTAYTVFQGIRFPIEKAFYIVYIVLNEGHKMTLDQLSENLDMRRQTVWSFKKKVQESIKSAKNDADENGQRRNGVLLEFGKHFTQEQK